MKSERYYDVTTVSQIGQANHFEHIFSFNPKTLQISNMKFSLLALAAVVGVAAAGAPQLSVCVVI